MQLKKTQILLNKSGEIFNKHQEAIRAKGEDFNIFSILGMETDETKTHSAMLVALLDPKGNHYYDEKFLKLFLDVIGYSDYDNENLMLVTVQAEYHLGKISKEYDSGGFIDILITFPSGKAIAIENKINAKDQPNQMYRYSLFKGEDCKLYYLNKDGQSPTNNSLNSLSDRDYKIIAYNDHILTWLDSCLSITESGTILENAIRQYFLLIKKITNTMEKRLEDDLKELITNNLEEAEYISSHYQNAVNSIREKFRCAVLERLNQMRLVVNARLGNDINQNYSQIWLSSEALHTKGVQFGIESFSGKGNNNGRIFIGIFDKETSYNAIRDGDYRLSTYWPLVSDIKTKDKNPLNLASTKTLRKLSNNDVYFKEMVNEITDQTKAFVDTYHTQFI